MTTTDPALLQQLAARGDLEACKQLARIAQRRGDDALLRRCAWWASCAGAPPQVIHCAGRALPLRAAEAEDLLDVSEEVPRQLAEPFAAPLLWDRVRARRFACECATHVLPLFERSNPRDARPRQAIERVLTRLPDALSPAQLDAAGDDARDAAMSPTLRWCSRRAARAAAWVTAREAWEAARDAAAEAARAAGDAAWDEADRADAEDAWESAYQGELEWQARRLWALLVDAPS